MAQSVNQPRHPPRRFIHWLLEGHTQSTQGAYQHNHQHKTHPWWQVMCLTGVDYFSTLGYQPGIAALAAGALAPVATLILILLTLFGALPIYRHVAKESPHGEGSIAMLEHLLPWWQGKLFVLCLLGFVATDFIITITLSAADATAHIIENPFAPSFLHDQQIALTLLLVTLLAIIFLRGFNEAIGIAVILVGVYLFLNLIVVGVGLYQVALHPRALLDWERLLFTSYGNPIVMIGLALLLFPKLALGLSGFETGVAVMPLVQGDPDDTEAQPTGRIRNTGKLLTTAALTMSVFLITSSVATIVLIPPHEFASNGSANGRALAYLAHIYLGDIFGTVYDLSTICILWFAGASAMAGLLNIVPRYLPRYGMAPEWTRANRPLVLVFAMVAFAVTLIFRASVDAQGGAYATGVLVLMSSAAVAVTLSVRQQKHTREMMVFSIITFVFIYTTIVNIIERPEGVKIATFFIGAIVITSLVSRVWRSTELRVDKIEFDETAQQFMKEMRQRDTIRLFANDLDIGDAEEYHLKEQNVRAENLIPEHEPVFFLEVSVRDPSEFSDTLKVHGVKIEDYHVLRAESTAVPNAIAAFLLYLRDHTGKLPHIYFEWTEGNPLAQLVQFILFGEGDIAPVTHEVLRVAEPDPKRRPAVHIGG